MKKSLLCLCLAACGMLLPLYGKSPKEARAQFDATVKYVDAGGEVLYYQDNQATADFITRELPPLLKMLWKDAVYAKTADCALDSLIKIINLGAFKAQAASSIEVEPGIFVAKSFALTDLKAKSILFNPAWKNQPVNLLALPADTRIALKFQIDLGHIWSLVYDEIRFSADPEIKKLAVELKDIKENAGIDIAQIVCSINGDMELLITGTNLDNAAIKLVIPDKNGKVAELLQKFIPPSQGSKAKIPTEFGDITVVYEAGKITAVTDAKLLAPAVKTLAASPKFVKFSKMLPASGYGYCVIDLPQELIDLAQTFFADAPAELAKAVNTFIRPASLAAVFRMESDGLAAVAVSDFSMAQLTQKLQCLPAMIGGIAAVANLADDDSAVQVKCQNDLKQFATACFVYAIDHKDVLPDSMDDLIKEKLIDDDICENIIFVGCGKKMAEYTQPAVTPIAFCDGFAHDENSVCIAFADGHVESMEITEDDCDEKKIALILHETYKFPAKDLAYIIAILAEEDAE